MRASSLIRSASVSGPNKIFTLVKHFENNQAKLLTSHFIDHIDSIMDQKEATLLHVAANNGNCEMAEHFISEYKKINNKESSLGTWVNLKDSEGFTCLHYASFRGNYRLVKLFEENGADLSQVNGEGLTVLHIAAQGDSPLLIYYFLNKGIKISTEDFKGNTALHWACYSGMENAVFALISWEAQINKKENSFGMTPLHLAVLSGNSRIVKKLLIKGCDRQAVSLNGKKPIELAKQKQFTNIVEIIEDKNGFCEFFNFRTPFRRPQRFSKQFYLLVFLFSVCYVLNIVSFIISLEEQEIFQVGLFIAFIIIGGISSGLFIALLLSNPGKLQNRYDLHRQLFQKLLKNKPAKLCFDCGIVKPQRSKHCEICNSCISVYDHHCPWLANCIGSENYSVFYTFLVFMLVLIIITLALAIANFAQQDWHHIEAGSIWRMVVSGFSLLLSLIFIVPVSILMTVQTRNMLENTTTFERYTSSSRTPAISSTDNSRQKSPSVNRSSFPQSLVKSGQYRDQVWEYGTPWIRTGLRAQYPIEIIRMLIQITATICAGAIGVFFVTKLHTEE